MTKLALHAAARLVLDSRVPLVLVHGRITHPCDPRISVLHAWVELPPGTTLRLSEGTTWTLEAWAVHDPLAGHVYLTRDQYYRQQPIHVVTRYSQGDIREYVRRYQHWGPWE